MILTFLIAVVGILGIGALVYVIARFVARGVFTRSLGLELLLIKIPKENPREGFDFKVDLNRFEQLLANLAGEKGTFVFELAVPHVGEEIHFYLAVPKLARETAVKQVQGIWNGASIEPAPDDYTIFNPNGAVATAYLLQKDHFALPLRTYADLEADTMSSILGGFTRINEVGEGAALQLIVRGAPAEKKKTIKSALASLKKGDSIKKVLGQEAVLSFANVAEAFGATKEEKKDEPKIIDEQAVKALEAKIAKPLFEVNIRLLASASSPFQANDMLDGLIAGFHQFGGPGRNELKIVKVRNPQKITSQFILRTFEDAQTMVITSEEIASIYHFPGASTETPRVKWLKSKEAAPPANLPKGGTLVGESVFRGERKPVYITDEDRRRHIYTIGQTGTGKSTLLGDMIVEDMKAGKGLAIIDPHGSLIETALTHIPESRKNDVILFDPGDLERPLGLNMLDFNFARPEEKTFIVNEMQGIFNKLFSQETMGPMFEQYMRNALLLLMEDMANEPATLVEVPRVFTDVEYRKRKLARIGNPVVVDFWEKEAIKAGGEASLANMTPYITSKFNNFISNDYLRPIIGQPKSAFNFREAMDSGKILLISLPKGKIGDINAGLLGMIVIGKILMAALSRVDTPDESKRRDFNLYIDEFHNFTTDSIATILSEARKYRLSLIIANQFIAQLKENIRDAVFGNIGSMVIFRVGVQDAEFLVKQFEPTFNENDLINIDNLNAYAKILINGQTSQPFNIKIKGSSWAGSDKEMAEKVKELSRTTYGKDRQDIEMDIKKRLRE